MFQELLDATQTILCSLRVSDFPTYEQELEFCRLLKLTENEKSAFFEMNLSKKTKRLEIIEEHIKQYYYVDGGPVLFIDEHSDIKIGIMEDKKRIWIPNFENKSGIIISTRKYNILPVTKGFLEEYLISFFKLIILYKV